MTVFHKKAPGTEYTAEIPIVFTVDPNFVTNDRSFQVVTLDDGSKEVRITGCSWEKIVELKKDIITQNEGVQVKSKKLDCNGMNITEVDDEDNVLAIYGIPCMIGKQKSNMTCGIDRGKYYQGRCFWCDVFQQNARFRSEWNPITNSEVSPLTHLLQ